jgi:hypothetical protein
MTATNLRLIRRVQGPLGSLRLYRHARVGLAEVMEVHQGRCQIIDLRRHTADMLTDLLTYADEVQRGVDAGDEKPKAAKRTRIRWLGRSGEPGEASKLGRGARAKAAGAAEATNENGARRESAAADTQ